MLLLSALLVFVPVSAVHAEEPSSSTASIQGKVIYPAHVARGVVSLKAYEVATDGAMTLRGEVYPKSDDTYVIGSLPAGKYKLFLDSVTANLVDTWWGGALVAAAGTVTVGAGEVRTGIDFSPWKGASITGRVTFTDEANPYGNRRATAYVYRADDADLSYGYVGADSIDPFSGTFEIDQLPPGDYKVRVLSNGSPSVWTEWWNDTLEPELATVIALAVGEPRTGVDTVLSTELHSLMTGSPTVHGTFRAGERLTADAGDWPTDTSLTFTWFADGQKISSYGSYLWLESEHIGKSIEVAVTGTKSGYSPVVAKSAPSEKVRARVLTPLQPAWIQGTPVVGQYLDVIPGEWPNGTALAVQWYANDKAIPSRDGYTIQLTPAEFNAQISVKVTATRDGYETATVTVAADGTVAAGEPNVLFPLIIGEARVDQTVSVDPGDWGNSTVYAYQWLIDGVAIEGATSKDFGLTAAYVGKSVSVRVTGRAYGYPAASETSAAYVVEPGILHPAKPVITGDALVGRSLTVSPMNWAPGVRYTYQWMLNNVPISGATGATLTLTPAHGGNGVSVQVTGAKAGYRSESATTAQVRVMTKVSRIAGLDRFLTAAAVAWESFTPGVPVVYIANGLNFPDALAGAAVAGSLGGPVLLTSSASISEDSRNALTWLRPKRIVVLGGSAVVSDQVLNELKKFSGTVTRSAGLDRFSTAAAVSKSTFASNAPVVYIANGLNFPDALSGAAAAGTMNGPVLLVKNNEIPQSTRDELRRLDPKKILVLGGSGVVSDQVLGQLKSMAPAVSRLAGQDRFATASAISRGTFDPGVRVVYVASGLNFPDALAGAAAAGAQGGPVLLTNKGSLPDVTRSELVRLKPDRIVVLGGEGAVSPGVESQLLQYVAK